MAPNEEVRSPGCSLIQDGGLPLIPAIPTSPQLCLPTGFWRFHMFLTLPRGSRPLTHWGPTVLCVSSNAMVLLTWWLSTTAFWDTRFQMPARTCQEATAANCLSSGCRCHSCIPKYHLSLPLAVRTLQFSVSGRKHQVTRHDSTWPVGKQPTCVFKSFCVRDQ